MKFGEFWTHLFAGEQAVSSKRVCGFTGWIVSLFICLWCTLNGVEAPQIIDVLFICSTSLLGVEAITSVFRKSVGNKESQMTYRNEDEEPPKLL